MTSSGGEILAVVSGAVIAVGGWTVNQYQARRAVRRNMRIQYLLDAYRRFERISNRPMSSDDEQVLEAVIADVQLLGSPNQVRLAIQLAETFVAERKADSDPLLTDLRASLRRELLLEEVPPNRMWLRITPEGGITSERSRIWHDADQATQAALRSELADETVPPDLDDSFRARMRALAESASPSAAVEVSIQRVEQALRAKVEAATGESLSGLNVSQLASRGLAADVIDAQLADAINGLGVMRLMALIDQAHLSIHEAIDFVARCAEVLYVLNDRRGTPRR